jgi:hypothetical protein
MKIHLVDGKKYVEVERSPKLGDKVLIVNAWDTYDKYFNGSIIEVQRLTNDGIENYDVRSDGDGGNPTGFIAGKEYVVIESLEEELAQEDKTHVIEGVTYAEVDRKAKVGDMLWLVNIKMSMRLRDVNDVDGINEGIDDEIIKVLEPLKPTLAELCAKCTPENRHAAIEFDKPQVLDMLANLARRVTQLETLLSEAHRNIETWAQETQEVKHHAYQIERDVMDLEKSTQVLDAINKYYAEGSR